MSDKAKYYRLKAGDVTRYEEPGLVETCSVHHYSDHSSIYHLRELVAPVILESRLSSQSPQYEVDQAAFEEMKNEAERLWASYQKEVKQDAPAVGYKYGWMNGDGKTMQYVGVDTENTYWGRLTTDINEARVFPTIEDCQIHWLYGHAFPEQYYHCLHDGYLRYFKASGEQVNVQGQEAKPWPRKKQLRQLAYMMKGELKKRSAHLVDAGLVDAARFYDNSGNMIATMAQVVTAYCNTPGLEIRECQRCHEPYFGNIKSKYCSTRCRVAAHKKKQQSKTEV